MQIQPHTIRWPHHRVAAYLSEAVQPLLQWYALRKVAEQPTQPESWRRIVLLGANHIGDALWLTPSFPTLAQGFPNSQILVVTSPAAAEALAHNPYLSRTVISHETSSRLITGSDLRSLKADAIICYDTSAAWLPLLTAIQAGIPNRVGYIHKGFSGWVTHPIPLHFPQPHPAYFRDLVSQLTGLAGPDSLYPCIYPDASDQAQADAVFARFNPDSRRFLVACFPFGRQKKGQLPSEAFSHMLNLLDRQIPLHVVLAGTHSDAARLNQMATQIHVPCSIMAGDLNIRALSVFLKRCAFVLSTDSGPRHIANSNKIPVFFIPNRSARLSETGVYVPTEVAMLLPNEKVGSSSEWAHPLVEQILRRMPFTNGA